MSSDTLTDIYVNSDLTKTERDQQYLLRQKNREQNNPGEEVATQKGRVVSRSAQDPDKSVPNTDIFELVYVHILYANYVFFIIRCII